jgi:hypothetical protein
MSVEQSQSDSANSNVSGYGCCRAEWENAPQSAPDIASQDGLGQGLPQYYLPCSD